MVDFFAVIKRISLPCRAITYISFFSQQITHLGLNGGASNIWDFVSGSFSPSPSPVFSNLTSTTSSADLTRLFRELDEAKRKIKQWEEAWQQVKQVSVTSKLSLQYMTAYQKEVFLL